MLRKAKRLSAFQNVKPLGFAAVAAWWLCASGGAALAQSMPVHIDNMPNVAAIGVGFAPDYLGSDEYTAVVGPSGRMALGGMRYVELVATQLSLNVVDHRFIRMGPTVNYRFGRDEVSDEVVDRMEKIDDTVELGAFFGIETTNAVNPRIRLRAGFDVLVDLGGEHDSFTTTISARYWRPLSLAFDFGIGASVTYGGSGYMERFFGVSAADSVRTGFSTFDANSGVRDLQISPVLMLHLSSKWHLGAGVQYRRLLDDAADSPLVEQRGSRDQFIGGIAAVYSW